MIAIIALFHWRSKRSRRSWTMPIYYAHSLEDEPPSNWQRLEKHLLRVAKLAARFAEAFDSESWGFCAGLWHDLGKYQAEFQQKLLGSKVSVEHSGTGAALAFKKSKEFGVPLAFVIAGHPQDSPTSFRANRALQGLFWSG